jgi:hypothetical protein
MNKGMEEVLIIGQMAIVMKESGSSENGLARANSTSKMAQSMTATF